VTVLGSNKPNNCKQQ